MDFISAIAFADVTVEFQGYFLRWTGWQVMLAGSLLVLGCGYLAIRKRAT